MDPRPGLPGLRPNTSRDGGRIVSDAGTTTVALRDLSVTDDGEECIIGDPSAGTFINVPAVGGVVVRSLLAGRTVAEATAEAEAFAGETVNVASFVETLDELGFVAHDSAAGDAGPTPTAPVQQRTWFTGADERVARWFFGRTAWTGYALAALFSLVTLVVRPDLLPLSTDAIVVADFGISALIVLPVGWSITALHEYWHWLAARALGLQSRFGIDVRYGVFLVFETDLTQIWSVARRRRYGPQLAGMAVQGVLLAATLLAEVLWRDAPFLRLLVLLNLATLMWQAMVFLRSDLYAVLVTATGCTNLWETTQLRAKAMFHLISAAERQTLNDASAADRRVSRWFVHVWLIGPVFAVCYLVWYLLPWISGAAAWTVAGLAASPATGTFWWTLASAVALFGPLVLTAAVAARAGVGALRARAGRATPA
jgi:putative peptide zinc metalloprotease protein